MRQAHVRDARRRRLARGEAPAAAESEHLARCRSCRDQLQVEGALWLDPERRTPPLACLDARTLVRASEGARLTAAERRRLRRHVPGCGRCAAELEALTRAGQALPEFPVRDAPRPRSLPSLADRLRALLSWSMPPSLALAARSPARALPGFQRAMRAYRGGRFDEARQQLLAARERGEGAPELDFYLGCCWLDTGRSDDAARSLAAAVARRPRVGDYRYYLAQALLACGRAGEALAALERAAALPGAHRAEARRAVAGAGEGRPGGRTRSG